jgi:hypothetical protein
MAQASGPIRDEEYLLRRIPLAFRDAASGAIKIDAFLPTPADTDGFSVDLATETSAPETAKRGAMGKRYHVARLNWGELKRLAPDLHLTVERRPEPDNGAHCIIPEIRRELYEADKARYKGLANAIVVELMKSESKLGGLEIIAFPG